ncbi:hypothetical protein [Plebeiibacterium sediminum]|uniref:Uncharacterized protein n=1 Tax=Plebeiibacterium sediminum TaxID=2992112 RepID=A0AAE3M7D4_9BACT|nr:hypothetical protein [Plebeiobacterium sediminum]MCW3788377.1 hypothetical protein [Plebeiobacterium sediminum]
MLVAFLFIILIACENEIDNEIYNKDIIENVYSITLSGDQTITYNTIPERITLSVNTNYHSRPPKGIYQKSIDGKNWTNVKYEYWNRGEDVIGYQPGALTQTTYYRLIVNSIISNIITITIIEN